MTAQDADGAAKSPPRSDGDADGAPAAPSTKRSSESGGRSRRIYLRNWRISTRLVSLLALPVAAATGLGVLRIDGSLDKVEQLENMQMLADMTDHATRLASALQEERDRSAGPLTGSGSSTDDTVVASRELTDQAKRQFGEHTSDIKEGDPAMSGVAATVVDIARQLNSIKTIRERAYEAPSYVSQTVNNYNQLIESLLSLSLDMAQATSNSDMIRSTRALAAFSSAKEYASIQRAIIAAGLARETGPELSESDRLYAVTASESEAASIRSFIKIYGENRAPEMIRSLEGGIVDITSADQYASRVLKDPDGIKTENRSYMDWFDQDREKIKEMTRIEGDLLSQMEDQAEELRSQAQQDALLNGALILLVLGISLVGAFIVARSMVRSLRRLQDTAQDVARNRLPELVRQLSEAEPQDVDTSVQSVGVHSRDEIGRVAAAFDDVHREAVRLAGEQALLRGNVNAMFTNLSRRSQSLIQRQLSLISELESREADPDQLSSLFKLDHLATRMRRNGENLLVLAGEEPGRRWTRPVPLVDVLRAAASEVEQYERIELNSVPSTEVAGRVVNDLVHLLAELLENATSFSSPQTKVKVTGHALPDGRVLVEIHDTGIGLSPDDLAAINDRLANPPTVDVSVSRRMGLFVVGRLSLRHGIRIQLRPSDSGGTTALVMLPVDVAQGGRGRTPAAGGTSTTLQREPQGANSPGRTGTSGRLGALPTRGQVAGTAQRPALPAQGNGDRPSGGPSATGPLPTRPGRGSGPAGAGPGPNSGPGPNPNAGPGAGPGTVNLFGANELDRPRPRAAAPTRGDAPPPGQPSRLSVRGGPPPELPGAEESRPGWPESQPERAPSAEVPRDHDDRESTGEYAQPRFPGDPGPQTASRGPGDTAQFARPDFDGPPPGSAQSTGQHPVPGSRQDTGQHPLPNTGQRARPDSSQDTGQHRLPAGPQDTGQHRLPPSPQDTGQHPLPAGPQDTGQHRLPPSPQDTGQHRLPTRPGLPERPSAGRPNRGGDPNQGRHQSQNLPSDGFPAGGVPSAGGRTDERTPIFESMESNWFNTPQAGPGEPAPTASAEHPRQAAPSAVPPNSAPPTAGQPDAAPNDSGSPSGWGAAPNDERWRQAEQVRQPAAGGVTTSGLPRRVPRANLVAGTAQQQANTRTGPQVSRAPDDIRGRLTNLRRGIQQGRQAGNTPSGSTDRGFGPTYQQER